MSMRFYLGIVFVLLVTVAIQPRAHAQENKRRPNILFIAVDDLNCNIGCYGHPVVKTPNIDRLAARGVRFDRAYCQYPLCNPSRTSLLSGRRPDETRIVNNNTPPRTYLKDVVFLPEQLHANGYFTARVGKIAHGAYENAVKWDVSEQSRAKKKPAAEAKADDEEEGGALKISWRATNNKDDEEPDGNTARRIVKIIEEYKDKPFFIAAGFHKPHLPFVAPKKYFDMYPADKIVLPKSPVEDRKDKPNIALTRTAGDEMMTEKQKREAIAAYYACVSFTDANVGILLDALDRLKLTQNTIIVFWGDHGFHLAEHGGLWRKMTVFEESARVPLIVAAPGKKTNSVSPRLVELVDLYPTLCELCGVAKPQKLEGTSFVPLLDDPSRHWKKAVYTQVARGKNVMGRSVRTERYCYTEWGTEKTAEFYDHQDDPHEWYNRVHDPIYAGNIADLRRLLKEGWRSALPTD